MKEHTYSKSASLKAWMEGGTVDDIFYSACGNESKSKIMNVTLKSIDEFEIAV